MKHSPSSPSELAPLLVFGSHPDDIEFGCGGAVWREMLAGRPGHFAICSRGESGSHGTPEQRVTEAVEAARLLKAEMEFVTLDGDSHLEIRSTHAISLAGIIRRIRPAVFVRARVLFRISIPIIGVLGPWFAMQRGLRDMAGYQNLASCLRIPSTNFSFMRLTRNPACATPHRFSMTFQLPPS